MPDPFACHDAQGVAIDPAGFQHPNGIRILPTFLLYSSKLSQAVPTSYTKSTVTTAATEVLL